MVFDRIEICLTWSISTLYSIRSVVLQYSDFLCSRFRAFISKVIVRIKRIQFLKIHTFVLAIYYLGPLCSPTDHVRVFHTYIICFLTMGVHRWTLNNITIYIYDVTRGDNIRFRNNNCYPSVIHRVGVLLSSRRNRTRLGTS